MATEVSVAAVRAVGPDAVALDISTPEEFDASPGQFVKLTASPGGEEESRFYTVSSPRVGDTFEVTIEIDPDGALGPWLADREPGDTLTLDGPFGNTYYEGEQRVVVLAGGPGVGPAIGIAERALEDGNEAAVVYRDDDPIHADRLDALEERGAFVAVLGAEASMVDAVGAALADGGQVFVYGFADFLDDAIDAIGAAGGDPDRAKVENFG
jgi:ferredoxin-NADP reductase